MFRYEIVHWYETEDSYDAVTEVLTRAVDVDGLFSDPLLRGCPPVTLIGVENPARVQPLERGKHPYACGERLHALDRHGRVMAKVPIALDVVSVAPSALGDGLFDVVLAQSPSHNPVRWRDRPAPSARAVWDLWREGVPAERNLWGPFDEEGREAWGHLTFLARKEFEADEVGGVYELDGRHATDVPGLHLAMSEALVGPGGYFGREFNAFKDCLGGGWGVKPGFTLVWHDAQVAHEAIPDYFQDVLKLLRQRGVAVELKSSRRTALGELAARWAAGWAKAAGLSAESFPDSLQVSVDQHVEHVLTDEGQAAWHLTQLRDGDWITVATTAPDEVTALFTGAGLEMRLRETLMRRALADHPAPEPPEGFEVRVTPGDVIEVVLSADGAEAASGLMAVIGEDAVPHRIRTSPEHRRHGLGSVVMGLLAREAVKAGAEDGLLFATGDGLHLYRKLGWTTVSDVVIASRTKGEA